MVRRIPLVLETTIFALVLTLVSRANASPGWQLVHSQPNSGNAMVSISAVDSSHAWAVGMAQQGSSSSPVAMRTLSGSEWQESGLPQGGGGPMAITMFTLVEFSDENQGWLHGTRVSLAAGQEPLLWKTTDGGTSWTEAYKATSVLNHLQALPSGEMFGAGGTIVLTVSSAGDFKELSPELPSGMAMASIFMLNPSCGYLVASRLETGIGSAVMWTGDGGETWASRGDELPYNLQRMWFVSATAGWAVGDDGEKGVIVRTSDGGLTWEPQGVPDHPAVMGEVAAVTFCSHVRFFDDKRGVGLCLACTGNCEGEEGSPSYVTVLVRTASGGDTWDMDPDYEPMMTAPPFGAMMKFSGMFAMSFPDPNSGFMTGQNNLILRYSAITPEEEGWGPPACESGDGEGGQGGGDSGGGAGKAGASPEGDGGGEDSGCGCRMASGRAKPELLALLLCLVLARRRH